MADVTRLLDAAAAGDRRAAAELLPLVYDELRRLAAARMAAEVPEHTLQPTALVHEAFLRLVGGEPADGWTGRGHFFAAAAEAMRRVLVEAARRKRRIRHGGGLRRHELHPDAVPAPDTDPDPIAVDAALRRFAERYPVHARLVELRYFGGLTGDEAAGILGISPSTADRHWVFARAWLRRELEKPEDPENP
jgi:RNA polymerase sigma factor (TIGR02999 family)